MVIGIRVRKILCLVNNLGASPTTNELRMLSTNAKKKNKKKKSALSVVTLVSVCVHCVL